LSKLCLTFVVRHERSAMRLIRTNVDARNATISPVATTLRKGRMMESHSDVGMTWYGVPAGLWIIFFAGIASAIAAVLIAWRSNANSQKHLDAQISRGWQQLVRQLKHEAEQRAKQRVHESEQLSKQLAHDAEQKTKELQQSLRRDAYLEAAAALLNIHVLISRAAMTDCNETLLWESFAENHARVVRLHLIATEPTVEILMVYMNELAPAFVEMTARQRQIRARTHALPEHREGNAAEPAAAHNEEQVELLRRSISLTTQNSKLLAGALHALRSELEGSIDEHRYEQLWQTQFGKMEPIWRQDIENLRPALPHPPDLMKLIFP
jgi:gas vesicle protein